jgi:hypothetical protein
LGGAAGEVAGCRPAASGPGGAESALDLAAVGQAKLDVPLRAAGAFDQEGVAGDRAPVDAESFERGHGADGTAGLGGFRVPDMSPSPANHAV